ncbi:beta-ketoacyl synthase N-terminal-like domain-containing protein [Ramlibacter sp.]|uniref:beta-ketoacyl synthase N-terminal-like domain-containing protein n=1 Tax=Ramlibacter sp. TaxID=1917967 RepID=UPI0017E1E2F2|nr:beta-ketoacyl synthase N-terminal-like domain-containing protein [Ramlibacter sp.]MBA2672960.1 hypothetical protein [Ramlibacter sp.]
MTLRDPIDILGFASASSPLDAGMPPELLLPERRAKKVGALPDKARFVLQTVKACLPPQEALAAIGRERIGVSLGTVLGSMDAAEQCLATVRSEGFKGVTPSWYANGLPNATAAIVASVHGFQGPNLTLLGHASGLEALVMACRQIASGRVDAMLAGGFDWPSAWQLDRLQRSTEMRGASGVHAGAGLVWLARRTVRDEPPCGQVIGWSQSWRGADNHSLAAAAAQGWPDAEPVIHETACGAAGQADHLAAGAPLQLVRDVLMHGRSGRHAVVARGFGPAATCLLIQRPD